jgi:hypothetical protein
MSLARSTLANVVNAIKADRRTRAQQTAGCPSLRPSDQDIMDAFVEENHPAHDAAVAIVASWRWGGHPVTVMDHLPQK